MDSDWQLPEDASNPLGNLRKASNMTASPVSRALTIGAVNLIDKAVLALGRGDRERAEALVRRATTLAFDDHENMNPARFAVHQNLFSEITDALESEELGGQVWLDCVAATFDAADAVVRLEIARCLSAIRMDYELSRAERARLDRLLAQVDDVGDPTVDDHLEEPMSVPELLDVLTATHDFVVRFADQRGDD